MVAILHIHRRLGSVSWVIGATVAILLSGAGSVFAKGNGRLDPTCEFRSPTGKFIAKVVSTTFRPGNDVKVFSISTVTITDAVSGQTVYEDTDSTLNSGDCPSLHESFIWSPKDSFVVVPSVQSQCHRRPGTVVSLLTPPAWPTKRYDELMKRVWLDDARLLGQRDQCQPSSVALFDGMTGETRFISPVNADWNIGFELVDVRGDSAVIRAISVRRSELEPPLVGLPACFLVGLKDPIDEPWQESQPECGSSSPAECLADLMKAHGFPMTACPPGSGNEVAEWLYSNGTRGTK